MTHITFLIATPGRLKDHILNTVGMRERMSSIRILILDEADQLLDLGFNKDIEKIVSYLPEKQFRQTLLFSATLPSSIQLLVRHLLKAKYSFIDTIGEEEVQTHSHVLQDLVIVPLQDMIPSILSILLQHMTTPNYKIIVFFTTARVTGYMSQLLMKCGLNILEMHSRKSQSVRTKTSDIFRRSTDVIMFSSDVSARGMDYPNVTFVLQVGVTDKTQYIHRLGRTARSGQDGLGMLLLCEFEEAFMRNELIEIPWAPRDISLDNMVDIRQQCEYVLAQVVTNDELCKCAEQAYQSWLGFYNGKLKSLNWNKVRLVEYANAFALAMGLNEVPFLERKIVSKMGLTGTPGLKIMPNK